MSDPATYNHLRELADSWGLGAMTVIFTFLCVWPFRPGGRKEADEAANAIFEEGE